MMKHWFKSVLVLCGGFLCHSMLIAGGMQSDKYQRYVIIKNDLTFPIYPVVSVTDPNKTMRIFAYSNYDPANPSNNRGLQPNQKMKVYLPKLDNPQHINWYNSGRVYLFPIDPLQFETNLNKFNDGRQGNIVTTLDPTINITCELNGKAALNSCPAGSAKAAYPLDAPAQLAEYTFDAEGAVNLNFDTGEPMVDIDVSYVDDVYLPVALDFDNDGRTGYIGTTIGFDVFEKNLETFEKNSQWSMWAAYAPDNWKNNVVDLSFQDEQKKTGARHLLYQKSHIPAMYNFVHNVNVKATSLLYHAPQQGELSFLIAGTTGDPDVTKTGRNKALDLYVDRWLKWVGKNPCGEMVGQKQFWPKGPAFDDPKNRTFFCEQFKKSVADVWAYFAALDRPKDDNGNPAPDEVQCSKKYADKGDQDRCILSKIIGYRSKVAEGNLPEKVQAIMRGLPFIEQPYDLLLLTTLPEARPFMKPQPNGEDVFDVSNKAKVGNTFEIKKAYALVQNRPGKLYRFDDRGICKKDPTQTGECDDVVLNANVIDQLISREKQEELYHRNIQPSAFNVHLSVKNEEVFKKGLANWDKALHDNAGPNMQDKLGQLNEDGRPQYQLDKWLTFWISPSTDSKNVFSLNPFTHFVHATVDDPNDGGIDALSYSFSIDDKYGNVRDAASGFIIDVGGKSIISDHRYDPYQQYHVNWGAGDWGFITVKGSDGAYTSKRSAKGGGSLRIDNRVLAKPFYVELSPAGEEDKAVRLKLTLQRHTVVDQYTGLEQIVETLVNDQSYCVENTNDDSKKANLVAVCGQVDLNPVPSGELVYSSLSMSDRPRVNVNLPGFAPIDPNVIRFHKPGRLLCEAMPDSRAKVTWPAAFSSNPNEAYQYQLSIGGRYEPACDAKNAGSCVITLTNYPTKDISLVAIPSSGKGANGLLQGTCD